MAILIGSSSIWAQVNMIGRQSQNEGIWVLPASTAPVIDGNLTDWNTTGSIRCFADQLLSDQYAAQVTAMWDDQYLYYAVRWNDPTPLGNMVDPRFNPDTGWKSDCLQLRFKTADQVTWIDGWYHLDSKSSVIRVTVWDDMTNWRQNKARSLVAPPGKVDLGEGAAQAFAKTDTGYIQEMRIPWKMLYRNAPSFTSGLTFQLGMEFLWGDPAGGEQLAHRYADNIQAGITSREFYWNTYRVWGNATLTDQNSVPLREYIPKSDRLTGPVPITFTLPADAQTISLAIDDATGKRVRNLGGLAVSDYITKQNGKTVDVTISWDTCADATFKGNPTKGYETIHTPVSPGSYTIKALYHTGIDATYEMSYYNPGTPVWDVADGSGAWGADHTTPHLLAASGERMIIAWELAEGGWGIIAIGENGRKIWSEKRGATALAADRQYVYAVPEAFGNLPLPPAMIRLDAATGDYRPFIKDGKPLPFELKLEELFDTADLGHLRNIAVGQKHIALSYERNAVVLLDKHDAHFVRQIAVPSPMALTFDHNDQLYVISDGKLCMIDAQNNTITTIPTPGLIAPVGLACDAQGNLLMADCGPDSQIKAYTPQGKLTYTCGQQGGRAIRGKYDPKGMLQMSSVAVNDRGQIWVTESWNYPRRVSVWDRDGKLVKDYLGNTGYAANATCLHDTDPSLAYLGPLEFKIDHARRTWSLQNILWYPDESRGECFVIPTDRFAKPQRFSSSASGQKREYFLSIPYYNQHGYVLYMQLEDGNWKPVTAITTVSQITGKIGRGNSIVDIPSGEWADCDLLDGVFWNDTNADGIVQRSECQIVKTEFPAAGNQRRKQSAINFTSGWGGRMDENLRFYASGMIRVEPVGFDDRGAPVFKPESIKHLNINEGGTFVPDNENHQVLVMSMLGYPAPSTISAINTTTGKVNWSYPNPFPGVHGSHRATMPKPGLIIGPLLITGKARVNDEVGNVFHMRGNLGQDYFMTSDGLFIDTLFADGRLPAPPLPQTEAQLVGQSVNKYTQSGEAFNGFFGRQADGKYRLTCALSRQACMILDVHGLESIKRLPTQTIAITNDLIAKALQMQAQTASEDDGDKSYDMAQLSKKFEADGKDNEWASIPSVTMARDGGQQSGIAKLAYDAKHLYLHFDVKDPTPWLNQGKEFTRLFKTGDAIDVQLSPSANNGHDPVAGDLRIVIAELNGKPHAVLMMPIAKVPDSKENQLYTSPVMTHPMDKVVILSDTTIHVSKTPDGYKVEAAITLKSLDLQLQSGMTLRGDVGFISSDATGRVNNARTYWSNKQTNLVSDLPSEAWLYPQQWGSITVK